MKIKRFKSLSFKLTIWYIVILGIIILVTGLFLYEGFRKSLIEEVDKNLYEIAIEVNKIYWKTRGVTWKDAIQQAEEKFRDFHPFIQVVRISYHKKNFVEKIIHTMKIDLNDFNLGEKIYYKVERTGNPIYATFTLEKLTSYPIRVVLLPVRGPYIIQVGASLEKTINTYRKLLIIMILTGVLLLLLASFGGNLIIRKALLPIKSVVRTAKEITAEDLSLRIDSGNREDEIGELIETFNNMIARLEKSIKKIKQFSADVSHELRTPLTIIRGEIEVLLRKEREKNEYKKALKSILEETCKMEKIVEDLLLLSRIDVSKKIKLTEKIFLDEILLRVFEKYEQLAKSKKINFSIRKIEPSQIKGNSILVERMISNIIDNAIRYTPPNGKVEISLRKNGNFVSLSIKDTGIGIPEEALPHIFDRFYVVDKSRSKEHGGVGLGLSIVKSVAKIHGAKIDVQSKVNEGTIFEIKFPLI